MDTSGHDKNPATLINGYTAFETMQGRNTFSFSARGFLAERDSKVYAPRTGAYMRMTNDIEHLLGFFRMGWSGYLAGNFSSLKLYYNT
ncbi:MAG: hypothetical protein GX817_00250, partial [Elusimicrobia bacterium]|nr:hypothetical protein [Elusimicrobiota bacterium]